MTVKELIAELQTMDQDRIIVLARDSEGNGYSICRVVDVCAFKDGDIGLEALTPGDIACGYGEEDVMSNGQPAVVLWP